MKPNIIIIVAGAQGNRVIGTTDNQLPWPRLKLDMDHFRDTTLGYPVIMGRVTFETLKIVNGVVKPLPHRQNIVVTHNPEYNVPKNVWIANSLERAIERANTLQTEKICIIGGEQIYKLALPVADEVFYSRIELEVEGTTRFPPIPAPLHLKSNKAFKQEGVLFPDGTVRSVDFKIEHWVRRIV